MTIFPLFQGLALGLSMILPIGAQNAFVLNQGIKRNHHLTTAGLCMLCDFSLIVLGIYGSGALIAENERLLITLTWGGTLFLAWYGFLSFRAIFKAQYQQQITQQKSLLFKSVVLTTLAVSLLNPHVYLDTVVILGGVGSQFVGGARLLFTLGCMLASLLWFYALALTAAKLAPVLSKKSTRQIIDFVVGCIMWLISFSLFKTAIS